MYCLKCDFIVRSPHEGSCWLFSFEHCNFPPYLEMSFEMRFVTIPRLHALSIYSSHLSVEQFLFRLHLSLRSTGCVYCVLEQCPKAEFLINLVARQRVIFQAWFPHATRAYSLEHMGHYLPHYITWFNQEAGTLSQAGCMGKTWARIVVLQAAPKTGLDN